MLVFHDFRSEGESKDEAQKGSKWGILVSAIAHRDVNAERGGKSIRSADVWTRKRAHAENLEAMSSVRKVSGGGVVRLERGGVGGV